MTISTSTPSATIYYTTNGTTPTTSSPVYAGPVTVAATETLQAIAIASGNSSSPVGSAVYTITLPAGTPSFSPAPGTYNADPDRDHLHLNPLGHDLLHHQRHHAHHQLAGLRRPRHRLRHETLQAIAVAPGNSSPGRLGRLHHHPARRNSDFSPAPGTYNATQTVTISTSTPAATIYYTTNGTTPTTSSAGLRRPRHRRRHRDPAGHRHRLRQLRSPVGLGRLHHHPARRNSELQPGARHL